MIFIEAYIKKCLENTKYLRKTSIIGGGIIGLILGIIEMIKGGPIEVSIVIFVVLTIIFSFFWSFAVKRMAKVFSNQDSYYKGNNKKGKKR